MGVAQIWKAALAPVIVTRIARVTAITLVGLILCGTAFCRSRNHAPKPRLFPTEGSLLAQNAEADRLGLPRIQTDAELQELVADGSLVTLPISIALKPAVPRRYGYLKPQAAALALDLAQAFYTDFHRPLRLTSAVRTVRFQNRLRHWNRNAAPAHGEKASVHTTGLAFDIAWSGLTRTQKRWLEWRLFYLQGSGRALVEEEVHQPCFHIVVVT
jgi:hypothetical protein